MPPCISALLLWHSSPLFRRQQETEFVAFAAKNADRSDSDSEETFFHISHSHPRCVLEIWHAGLGPLLGLGLDLRVGASVYRLEQGSWLVANSPHYSPERRRITKREKPSGIKKKVGAMQKSLEQQKMGHPSAPPSNESRGTYGRGHGSPDHALPLSPQPLGAVGVSGMATSASVPWALVQPATCAGHHVK